MDAKSKLIIKIIEKKTVVVNRLIYKLPWFRSLFLTWQTFSMEEAREAEQRSGFPCLPATKGNRRKKKDCKNWV